MIHNLYQRHRSFGLLFILFLVFRLLALLLLRPGGFLADASDYDFYETWGQLTPMGYRTFENLWTAYPPLFPALMLPIFELASRIPPWVEPRFFFHTLFGLELLLFECGNLVLIYGLAGKLEIGDWRQETNESKRFSLHASSAALQSPLIYALLFTPVYTLLGWFEAMPLFFLLLGLDLLLSRRRGGWIGSALAVALGFLTKLTPAVLAPVAVRWLGAKLSWSALRHEWFNRHSSGNLLRPALYGLILVGTIVGLGYGLVDGETSLALSSLRVNALRPPWQSLWALLDGYYGFGLVPVDMRNLIGLEQVQWSSRLPWAWITAAFGLIYLWIYTRRYDWRQPRTAIGLTAVSVIWLFLYSKGWSPQFLVWILAFLVLLLPTLRGVILACALSVLNVVESHGFLILLPNEHWLLVGTVLARTLLLLLLLIEFLGQIWPTATTGLRMQQVSARLGWVVLGLMVIGLISGAPRAAQAYTERRLAEQPCNAAIVYLREQAVAPGGLLITDQPALWRELYPWLRHQYQLHVIDGYNPQDRPWPTVIAERLVALVQDREFWLVQPQDQPGQFAAYLALPGVHVLEQQTAGACSLRRVIQLPEPAPGKVIADGATITLRQIALQAAEVGEVVHVVLYWQADQPVTTSYTVFTQLFDPAGQLAAQQDNPPQRGALPTTQWSPGQLVRDAYGLTLPVAAPPGRYQLLVGLYTDAGRLTWQLPAGTSSDHLTFQVDVSAR